MCGCHAAALRLWRRSVNKVRDSDLRGDSSTRLSSTVMPLLLPSILANSTRPQQPFILAQSSASHTCLPIIQELISSSLKRKNTSVYLFCFLHPPSSFTPKTDQWPNNLHVFDWTYRVPGYDSSSSDALKDFNHAIDHGECK